MMGEVQINVKEFVELKGRKGGGHEVFDFARTIMAYDPSTFKYNGELSERVFGMIGAGSILELDLRGQCSGIEKVRALAAQLELPTCRVMELR